MAARQMLFMAKDIAESTGRTEGRIYRLDTGWMCRVWHLPGGNRQILLIFLPGEFVGLKSLLYAHQPDTIECLTDATAHWTNQASLRSLFTSNNDVALRVTWQIAEEERRLHSWATGLGQCSAEVRMAAMLLDFRVRLHALKLVNANTFRLPMTRRDIGDYLGLTVVHIGRILERFRRTGLANVESRRVTIHDVAALARIASPMLDSFRRRNGARKRQAILEHRFRTGTMSTTTLEPGALPLRAEP
jgi:CRP-like cAMP-binding protein